MKRTKQTLGWPLDPSFLVPEPALAHFREALGTALILLASGSELQLILATAERLYAEGVAVRCVSMPSWDLFDAQAQRYRDEVLPPNVRARLAVELGALQGWHRYVDDQGGVMGMERFGASAPASVLMREFGFTIDDVLTRARRLLSS